LREKRRLRVFENRVKSVPLQAWSGPEGSRKLRFPNFVTTAQDDGRVENRVLKEYLGLRGTR